MGRGLVLRVADVELREAGVGGVVEAVVVLLLLLWVWECLGVDEWLLLLVMSGDAAMIVGGSEAVTVEAETEEVMAAAGGVIAIACSLLMGLARGSTCPHKTPPSTTCVVCFVS